MVRYIFLRYGFLLSCTVVWFAFLLAPYLAISYFTPLNLVDGGVPGGRNIFYLPFTILAFVSASVGAGVYYVVGRQILIFLRVWDEELANYSFKQLRYARRGYRVTPKPRRKRRDKA